MVYSPTMPSFPETLAERIAGYVFLIVVMVCVTLELPFVYAARALRRIGG